MKGQQMIPGIDREGGFINRRQIPQCYDCVRPGWRGLLDRAHLAAFAVDPYYTIAQVKQKFGRLCIYLNGPADGIAEIFEIESESVTVCEECGGHGQTVKIGSWYVTLCPTHEAAAREERLHRWT